MEEITLSVETRSDRGKGAARRLRRSGKVPAVFYGPKSSAMPHRRRPQGLRVPRRAISKDRT